VVQLGVGKVGGQGEVVDWEQLGREEVSLVQLDLGAGEASQGRGRKLLGAMGQTWALLGWWHPGLDLDWLDW